jgi:hypothetical protein
MGNLLILGVLVYMFLSTTVAAQVGVNSVSSASLVFFFLPVFSCFFLSRRKVLLKENSPELWILGVGLFVVLFKTFLGDSDAVRNTFFFMILPMLTSILISNQSINVKLKLSTLVIFFFVVECCLAIYERIAFVNIFPIIDGTEDIIDISDQQFRSTAFLGHPLANALVVSIIIGFILISN